jgi:hypothetical protein
LIQIVFVCQADSKPLRIENLAITYKKKDKVLHFKTSMAPLVFQGWKIDISVEIMKASIGLDGKLSLMLCAVLTH